MKAFVRFLRGNPFGAMVLLFGILGVVLAQLPDLFPNSDLLSLPPHLAALDAGLADLNQFDEKNAEGKAIAVLRPYEKGHAAIYDLLRVFNPSIPPLKQLITDAPSKDVGAIVSHEEITWNNPYGNISIFRPVQLARMEKDGLVLVPICDVRDLAFLIRDSKIRFWAGAGIGLTVVALILSVVPSTTLLSSLRRKSTSFKAEVPELSKKQLVVKESPVLPIWKLFLATCLGIFFGILWSKLRKRKVNSGPDRTT